MKREVTKKSVRKRFDHVISIGYCNAQFLLRCIQPYGYTYRREGWGANIYDCGNSTAIVTGYSPFGNINPAYDLCRKYDKMAETIWCDYTMPYEEQNKQVEKLLAEFIAEVCNNG